MLFSKIWYKNEKKNFEKYFFEFSKITKNFEKDLIFEKDFEKDKIFKLKI